MIDSPRVSIITSVYKCSDFLFEFFLDVKRQSIFTECELLIIDANEDVDNEDYKIISQFLSLPNIKYKHVGKCSVYEAWNIGVKLAKSEIVTNWNTDDRRKWNSLGYQVEYLENNKDVDLCYGELKVSNIKNETFEYCNSNQYWPTYEGTLENQLLHNSPHCLPVWRKDIHDRFGMFNESYFSAADYDMWFRILKGGGKMKKLKEEVGLYYANPNSISRKSSTYDKAVQEVVSVREIYNT